MDIVEFLRARLDEDEAVARTASPGGWTYGDVESVAGGMLYDESRTIGSVFYEQPGDHDGAIVRHLLSDEADANGRHIARNDPARVLREVEARRAILAIHEYEWLGPDDAAWKGCPVDVEDWPCRTVRALASVYADHPDYDPEWAD